MPSRAIHRELDKTSGRIASESSFTRIALRDRVLAELELHYHPFHGRLISDVCIPDNRAAEISVSICMTVFSCGVFDLPQLSNVQHQMPIGTVSEVPPAVTQFG